MLDQQKGNGGTMAAVSIFLLIRQSIVGFDRPLYYFGLQINEFGHMSFDVVRGQKDRLISTSFILEDADRCRLTFAGIQPVVAHKPIGLLYERHKILSHHFVDLCTVLRFEMVVANDCKHTCSPSCIARLKVLPGIYVFNLFHCRADTRQFVKRKSSNPIEPKAVPTVAQRVCSARRGNSQKHGRSSANVAARIAPGSASSVFTPLQAADVPDGSIAIACGLLDGAAQAS
jgi:hypothetical protein